MAATGSSPLTRGKPQGRIQVPPGRGLIPAHAGKTNPSRALSIVVWAHPRSRGENSTRPHSRTIFRGSSPLTRGKLPPSPHAERSARLIPAHAGKTTSSLSLITFTPAHPRSRGENWPGLEPTQRSPGSSPLTRGKRPLVIPALVASGLIPAHAGKTRVCVVLRGVPPAHPRSRGENQQAAIEEQKAKGSSPLTRGKRQPGAPQRAIQGLIPAHAGKTPRPRARRPPPPAHPRSRGENNRERQTRSNWAGSSPLTRGKRAASATQNRVQRLIPAHAGKTVCHIQGTRGFWAHPRSRGENPEYTSVLSRIGGSSPLTRGKRARGAGHRGQRRLIPAHAGKTFRRYRPRRRSGAHPRSRGENAEPKRDPLGVTGSSPLTRGKLRAVFEQGLLERLIPAHAGKTTADTSPSRWQRAHPRSRGENRPSR